MELAIQKIAIISLIIIGLSHMLQARAWAEFFIYLRGKGETGVFITAFIHLPIGLLVVGFHNVWHGIPLLLTVMGWGWCLKSLLYFVSPKLGLRMLARVSVERAWEFVVPGALMLVIAALLAYAVYATER
jgi:hypothetical protein